MNILYIHRTQGRGVEAVHILGMVDAFERLGHNVTIISPVGVKNVSVSNEDINKARSTTSSTRAIKWVVKNCPEVIFELAELFLNLVTYLKIIRVAKAKRIDFIYERYALNTFAGTLVAKKMKIPIVIEVNDATFIERVRKLAMKGIASRIENWVFRQVDHLATISTYFKELIAKTGISSSKISVLPNAVGEEELNRAVNPVSMKEERGIKDEIVIGYVGAFVFWHRVDMLLEAFANNLKENQRIKLLMVGDGVTFKQSSDYVKNTGIQSNVIFTGRVDHADVFNHIAAMDICVMPDSNDYGSPVKLFEYMAMGKAVIAPKLGPIEDVIKDRENGILFKKSEVTDLARAIKLLVDDKNLRSIIGERARQAVLQNHTWTKNAEKVLSFIKVDTKNENI
jgi:glycosyltransferase involved in cell wall biosynthesis